jgi:hypothetical protein
MCPKKLKNVSRCGEEVPPTKKKILKKIDNRCSFD